MVGALLGNPLKDTSVAITRPGAARPKNVADKTVLKKLLICAPSNAAVDELAKRLKAGIITTNGEHRMIKVVRMGKSDKINSDVKELCLEDQVQARLEKLNGGKPAISTRDQLHQNAAKIKEELAALRVKWDAARDGPDQILAIKLERDWKNKKDEQNRNGRKIDELKDSGMTNEREKNVITTKVQQEILDEADVLCSTLSGSGHDMFKKLSIEFETVIIDEAAQCVELSALIPLKYGCSKCVLVGDPRQLPPTVMAEHAGKLGYNRSLFLRMQENYPDSVHLLDTQYRMHPEISLFPSTAFYQGKLIDGGGMAKLRTQSWHAKALFGPFRWFDIKGVQPVGRGGKPGLINHAEIDTALQIYERLRLDFPTVDFRNKVGIITPYRAQLAEIKHRFSRKYGEEIIEHIDMNTADSFQGREADIIIFSCVRASGKGVGFLEDIKRMNVALTRAKSSLWVLGHSQTLLQDKTWASLINSAKDRQVFTEGDVTSLIRKPVTKSDLQAFTERQKLRVLDQMPAVDNGELLPMEGVEYGSNNEAKSESVDTKEQRTTSVSDEQSAHSSRLSSTKLPGPKPLARPASFGERMRAAARPAPKIRTIALDTNDNGKREPDSFDSPSSLEPPLKRLPDVHAEDASRSGPSQAAEVRKRSTAGPLNSALRAQAPKIIKKRPAPADPLRRGR